VAASAVQIDQGSGVWTRSGFGAPPSPGWRTKAMRFPSGDQRGKDALSVEGAIQERNFPFGRQTPIRA